LRNTERVLNNDAVERLIAKEKELGDKLSFADIAAEVAGVYPRIMKNGEMDAGGWSCGMVAGLIHDVPTVKELIDRIMSEAEAILRKRMTPMLTRIRAKSPAEIGGLSAIHMSHISTVSSQITECIHAGSSKRLPLCVITKDGPCLISRRMSSTAMMYG